MVMMLVLDLERVEIPLVFLLALSFSKLKLHTSNIRDIV